MAYWVNMAKNQKFAQNLLKRGKYVLLSEIKIFVGRGGGAVLEDPSPMLNIQKFAQNSPKMGQIRTFE